MPKSLPSNSSGQPVPAPGAQNLPEFHVRHAPPPTVTQDAAAAGAALSSHWGWGVWACWHEGAWSQLVGVFSAAPVATTAATAARDCCTLCKGASSATAPAATDPGRTFAGNFVYCLCLGSSCRCLSLQDQSHIYIHACEYNPSYTHLHLQCVRLYIYIYIHTDGWIDK